LSLWGEEGRKPIPMKVKRAVYEPAKGKCEKCGIPLEMNHGDFHHIRDHAVTPRVKSVRFSVQLAIENMVTSEQQGNEKRFLEQKRKLR